MLRFKVGDMVKVVGLKDSGVHKNVIGRNGIITEILLKGKYNYGAEVEGEEIAFYEDELELHIERKRGFEYIKSDVEMYNSFDGHDEWKIKLPKRATRNSAGYDIFAPFDFTLNPNEDIKIPTGLKAYMQDGEALLFFPRSSLGFKYYCRMANTIPVGDGDYYNNSNNEGHYWIKFRNEGNVPMEIKQGEAMCQAIFIPFLLVDGDNFEDGEDRVGGIGSTTKVKSDV